MKAFKLAVVVFATVYIASAEMVRADASEYGHDEQEVNSEVTHDLTNHFGGQQQIESNDASYDVDHYENHGYSASAENHHVPTSTIEYTKPVPVYVYKKVGVPVPHPVKVAVPHVIKVPVPQPIPVHIRVPQPVPIPIYKIVPQEIVKKIQYDVEKIVPYAVEKPFKVEVPKPIPVPVPVYKNIYHHVSKHSSKWA